MDLGAPRETLFSQFEELLRHSSSDSEGLFHWLFPLVELLFSSTADEASVRKKEELVELLTGFVARDTSIVRFFESKLVEVLHTPAEFPPIVIRMATSFLQLIQTPQWQWTVSHLEAFMSDALGSRIWVDDINNRPFVDAVCTDNPQFRKPIRELLHRIIQEKKKSVLSDDEMNRWILTLVDLCAFPIVQEHCMECMELWINSKALFSSARSLIIALCEKISETNVKIVGFLYHLKLPEEHARDILSCCLKALVSNSRFLMLIALVRQFLQNADFDYLFEQKGFRIIFKSYEPRLITTLVVRALLEVWILDHKKSHLIFRFINWILNKPCEVDSLSCVHEFLQPIPEVEKNLSNSSLIYSYLQFKTMCFCLSLLCHVEIRKSLKNQAETDLLSTEITHSMEHAAYWYGTEEFDVLRSKISGIRDGILWNMLLTSLFIKSDTFYIDRDPIFYQFHPKIFSLIRHHACISGELLSSIIYISLAQERIHPRLCLKLLQMLLKRSFQKFADNPNLFLEISDQRIPQLIFKLSTISGDTKSFERANYIAFSLCCLSRSSEIGVELFDSELVSRYLLIAATIDCWDIANQSIFLKFFTYEQLEIITNYISENSLMDVKDILVNFKLFSRFFLSNSSLLSYIVASVENLFSFWKFSNFKILCLDKEDFKRFPFPIHLRILNDLVVISYDAELLAIEPNLCTCISLSVQNGLYSIIEIMLSDSAKVTSFLQFVKETLLSELTSQRRAAQRLIQVCFEHSLKGDNVFLFECCILNSFIPVESWLHPLNELGLNEERTIPLISEFLRYEDDPEYVLDMFRYCKSNGILNNLFSDFIFSFSRHPFIISHGGKSLAEVIFHDILSTLPYTQGLELKVDFERVLGYMLESHPFLASSLCNVLPQLPQLSLGSANVGAVFMDHLPYPLFHDLSLKLSHQALCNASLVSNSPRNIREILSLLDKHYLCGYVITHLDQIVNSSATGSEDNRENSRRYYMPISPTAMGFFRVIDSLQHQELGRMEKFQSVLDFLNISAFEKNHALFNRELLFSQERVDTNDAISHAEVLSEQTHQQSMEEIAISSKDLDLNRYDFLFASKIISTILSTQGKQRDIAMVKCHSFIKEYPQKWSCVLECIIRELLCIKENERDHELDSLLFQLFLTIDRNNVHDVPGFEKISIKLIHSIYSVDIDLWMRALFPWIKNSEKILHELIENCETHASQDQMYRNLLKNLKEHDLEHAMSCLKAESPKVSRLISEELCLAACLESIDKMLSSPSVTLCYTDCIFILKRCLERYIPDLWRRSCEVLVLLLLRAQDVPESLEQLVSVYLNCLNDLQMLGNPLLQSITLKFLKEIYHLSPIKLRVSLLTGVMALPGDISNPVQELFSN